MTNIGERLKEERLRAGFTQIRLAQAIGIGQGTQTSYETGKRTPDANYLAAVHEVGLDAAYIVTGAHATTTIEPNEQQLITLYRKLDIRARRALIGALVSYLAD